MKANDLFVLSYFDRQQLPKLQEISISYPGISLMQARLLTTAIANTQLKRLNICFDDYPKEILAATFDAAQSNAEIKTKWIILGDKQLFATQTFSEEDMIALLQMMDSDECPTDLNLHFHDIPTDLIERLTLGIQSAAVQTFSLHVNSIEENDRLELLEAIVNNSTISKVSVKLGNVRFENKETMKAHIAQQRKAQEAEALAAAQMLVVEAGAEVVSAAAPDASAEDVAVADAARYNSEQDWVEQLGKVLDGTHLSAAINSPQVADLVATAKRDVNDFGTSVKNLLTQGRSLLPSFGFPNLSCVSPNVGEFTHEEEGAGVDLEGDERRKAAAAALK
jgi:hypothetical protein